MTSFDDAFALLIGNEGGYSNNRADEGGETMWGITKRVAQASGYTGAMQALTLEQARAIAKQHYWDVAHCDEYDPRVAFQIFDAVYNGGHPVLWAQKVCGTTADGAIGPATIAAIKAADPHTFCLAFLSYRLAYLTQLKTWMTFGRGWANRISANLLCASRDLS